MLPVERSCAYIQHRPGSSLLARQRVPGLKGETEPLDRGHRLVCGSRDQHSDCDFDVLLPEEDSAGSNRVNQVRGIETTV